LVVKHFPVGWMEDTVPFNCDSVELVAVVSPDCM